MALTASLPVIEDLAMKFNKHSLHDSFELPSYYQYPSKWQAKEFALYLQPNSHGFIVDSDLDQVAPFQFQAIGNFTTKRNNRNKIQNDRTSATRYSPKRSSSEQGKSNKPQTLNTNPAANSCTDENKKPSPSSAVKTLEFEDDSLSDDEELSGYFCKESSNDKFVERALASSATRSHNRKRSMEDDDCLTIKRCCRPRLNFDKMLLNSREILESSWTNDQNEANYFRPISPDDSLS